MEYEKLIKERFSNRSFSDKLLENDKLTKILYAGSLAPTAKNKQPQKIYVVNSNEGLQKIDKITPCRYNANTVLIVASDKNIAWNNGNYSTYEMDATIVATHMMLEATNLGVDNIWIEMFDKDKLKEIFKLEDNIEPICLMPLGYRKEDSKPSPLHSIRKPLKETVKYL